LPLKILNKGALEDLGENCSIRPSGEDVMNQELLSWLAPTVALLLSCGAAIAVTEPLYECSPVSPTPLTQSSTPRIEFRLQKPGTETQLRTQRQHLTQLLLQKTQISQTEKSIALYENWAALEKTYQAIAALYEPTSLDSSHIHSASTESPFTPPSPWQSFTALDINVEFDAPGSETFSSLTKAIAGTGRTLGIFLNGRLISAPLVDKVYASTGITGGQPVIAGNFTNAEVQKLAPWLGLSLEPKAFKRK
jgi:preprotein translocase subunit SecD